MAKGRRLYLFVREAHEPGREVEIKAEIRIVYNDDEALGYGTRKRQELMDNNPSVRVCIIHREDITDRAIELLGLLAHPPVDD